MNSVAPRPRADGHDRIADALCFRADQIFLVHHTDAHRVHQRIALVRGVEDDLARNGRNPDAVPVITNSFDDAGEQVSDPRIFQRPESQRVQHRDGSGAHREDIAQNPADARRGALVGLNG